MGGINMMLMHGAEEGDEVAALVPRSQ